MTRLTVLLLLPVFTGCATISPTHVYREPAASALYDVNREKPTPGAQGRDFCRHVENEARTHAVDSAQGGWALGVLSGLFLGTGVVMSAGHFNDSTIYRASSAATPLVGAVLGIAAFAAFNRARSAEELASTVAMSVNLEDREANQQCNVAVAAWNASRGDASMAVLDYINAKSPSPALALPPPSRPTPPASVKPAPAPAPTPAPAPALTSPPAESTPGPDDDEGLVPIPPHSGDRKGRVEPDDSGLVPVLPHSKGKGRPGADDSDLVPVTPRAGDRKGNSKEKEAPAPKEPEVPEWY